FALTGADDAADQVADSDRHFPPAFFPGADTSLRPGVSKFLDPRGRASGHRAQRVADHVDGMSEDGEFGAPAEQRVGHSPRNFLSLEKTKAINPARIKKGGAPSIRIPKSSTRARAWFCACAVR